MIIHDTDDEDNEDEDIMMKEDNEPQRKTSVQPIKVLTPRTRKAKDTQFRLGVGRPALAGGKGARAVTKSRSISKGKQVKTSKSVKPKEAAIQEEEEGSSSSWHTVH